MKSIIIAVIIAAAILGAALILRSPGVPVAAPITPVVEKTPAEKEAAEIEAKLAAAWVDVDRVDGQNGPMPVGLIAERLAHSPTKVFNNEAELRKNVWVHMALMRLEDEQRKNDITRGGLSLCGKRLTDGTTAYLDYLVPADYAGRVCRITDPGVECMIAAKQLADGTVVPLDYVVPADSTGKVAKPVDTGVDESIPVDRTAIKHAEEAKKPLVWRDDDAAPAYKGPGDVLASGDVLLKGKGAMPKNPARVFRAPVIPDPVGIGERLVLIETLVGQFKVDKAMLVDCDMSDLVVMYWGEVKKSKKPAPYPEGPEPLTSK